MIAYLIRMHCCRCSREATWNMGYRVPEARDLEEFRAYLTGLGWRRVNPPYVERLADYCPDCVAYHEYSQINQDA